ncbi:MAG: sulfotransferase domain-containing protein, partial [bacterium]
AGGMAILTDNIREADKDNPKGYYEFEAVKQLEKNQEWLPQARGKAVKIISQLLKHLPAEFEYKVIFIRRNMKEILASQKQMLLRRGEPTDAVADDTLADLFQKHLMQIQGWLEQQANFDILYVHHREALENPGKIAGQVESFLKAGLDVEKMQSVIDRSLHRQKF